MTIIFFFTQTSCSTSPLTAPFNLRLFGKTISLSRSSVSQSYIPAIIALYLATHCARLRRAASAVTLKLKIIDSPKACHHHFTAMSSPPSTPALGKKLHGRAFYESLGSPKLILAPMVDQSEFVSSSFSSSSSYIFFNLLTHLRPGMAYADTFLYVTRVCE